MNLIDRQNQKIKKANRLGLMTHVVAGYPSLEETRKIILLMVEQGVDFIEIQIPFSDPLGDGSTIRVANTTSLQNGFKVKQAFELVQTLREVDGIKIPLLFMTYFNIVHHYGIEKFCVDSRVVGIDGLIIPDYNFLAEPHEHLRKFVQKNNLCLIDFLSLDCSAEDLKRVGRQTNGFVYFFARRGITGAETKITEELHLALKKAKQQISVPVAVGFGVSEPGHIRQLQGSADMVVVGSKLLEEYSSGGFVVVHKKLKQLIQALK